MEKIFVFGGSNHAKLTIDAIEREGRYEVAGILDSYKKPGIRVAGYKILGPIEELDVFHNAFNTNKGIIAIGDNYTRYRVSKLIKQLIPEFEFVSAVHPSAVIGSRVQIGSGSILSAGVVVNNDCIIGDHCYLALNSGLSHDSSMGKFASLGPGAITGGNVKIGECTAICLGAKILNERTVGSNTVVGSGSLVYHDVGNGVLVTGIPARIVRERERGEPYL